jgi:hypothetical protein
MRLPPGWLGHVLDGYGDFLLQRWNLIGSRSNRKSTPGKNVCEEMKSVRAREENSRET